MSRLPKLEVTDSVLQARYYPRIRKLGLQLAAIRPYYTRETIESALQLQDRCRTVIIRYQTKDVRNFLCRIGELLRHPELARYNRYSSINSTKKTVRELIKLIDDNAQFVLRGIA